MSMTDLKIEKDVPLPPRSSGDSKKSVLWRMSVGDSVLVTDASQSVVAARAKSVANRSGYKFATRKVEGGVRVWRVA